MPVADGSIVVTMMFGGYLTATERWCESERDLRTDCEGIHDQTLGLRKGDHLYVAMRMKSLKRFPKLVLLDHAGVTAGAAEGPAKGGWSSWTLVGLKSVVEVDARVKDVEGSPMVSAQ
jgi:hypothetical protein